MQYHVQMLVTLELTDVTLEVGPGQSEGQGEGGADQTVTAQSPGHPGVRPVILIRENMIQSSCLLYIVKSMILKFNVCGNSPRHSPSGC